MQTRLKVYIYNSVQFLVDTGAEISVIPPKPKQRDLKPSQVTLRAANSTVIPTYIQRLLTLDLGLRRQLSFVFTIAQVHHPILGIDFSQHFDILVDVRSCKPIDSTTTLMVIGKATSINLIGLRLALPPHDEFTELLSQFPSILSPNGNANATNNVEHGVEHHIVTSGPPVFQRPRRLPPEKYKVAQQEFQFLLNQGIIRPSNSAWSSPLHMVPKKDPGD